MSTKTTFKRIALVAVAALGLGMLSVVPSSAIPNLTVTIVNGTAGLAGVRTDSTTAGTITVAGYVDGGDSVTISLVAGSFPIGGVPVIGIQNLDSTTSQLNTVKIDSQTAVTLLGTSMTLLQFLILRLLQSGERPLVFPTSVFLQQLPQTSVTNWAYNWIQQHLLALPEHIITQLLSRLGTQMQQLLFRQRIQSQSRLQLALVYQQQ